jgi:hypothetical protein
MRRLLTLVFKEARLEHGGQRVSALQPPGWEELVTPYGNSGAMLKLLRLPIVLTSPHTCHNRNRRRMSTWWWWFLITIANHGEWAASAKETLWQGEEGDLASKHTRHSFPTVTRKHFKEEPQSFVHCGSLDRPDLHSLNDYNFFFLVLPTQFLRIWGLLIYRRKRSWKYLSNGVLYVPK